MTSAYEKTMHYGLAQMHNVDSQKCAAIVREEYKDSNKKIHPFVPCDFEYIQDMSREYVKDAYDVISQNELWCLFRESLLTKGVNPNTGFTFTSDPLYRMIQNKISSTTIGSGHSGYSMGFVMRVMEYIALHGEPAYRLTYMC